MPLTRYCALWLPLLLACLRLHGQFSTATKDGTPVEVPDRPILGLKIYGTTPGQVLAVGPDGTVVGANLPWLSGSAVPVPATGSFTSINNDAVNYPYNRAARIYSALSAPCSEWLLPGDDGSAAFTACLAVQPDHDFYPGHNYGVPGTLSSEGSFVHHTAIMDTVVYSSGNHSTFGIVGRFFAPGDINVVDVQSTTKQAAIAGSDEGFHTRRETLQEAEPYLGSITSVKSVEGGVQLTMHCAASCNTLSLSTPLIDLSSGKLQGSISEIRNFALPVNHGEVIASAHTSYAVPVSTSGTLADDVDIPRLTPNTTLELSARKVAIKVKTSTPLAVGDLLSVMGPAFYEVVRVTDAPEPPSAGVQKISAVFRYSHKAGVTFCRNGAVGSYLELTTYTSGRNRYLENVMCSPDDHTIWVGHQSRGTLAVGAISQDGILPGPVIQYRGADVVGVLKPSGDSVSASDGYVSVSAGPAAWKPGDQVENTNHISAAYLSDFGFSDVQNPWAQRVLDLHYWFGHGGGLNALANGFVQFAGPRTFTDYPASGELYKPPWGIVFTGALSNSLAMEYAPIHAGGSGAAGFACDSGWVLCIGNGPAPGAPSRMGIFSAHDIGASITLDHSTGIYSFDSAAGVKALEVHGSTVCTTASTSCGSGYPVTADVTLTGAAADTVTIQGVTSSSKCSWGASNAIAGAVSGTLNAYYSVSSNTFTLHHATGIGAGATYGVICSTQ